MQLGVEIDCLRCRALRTFDLALSSFETCRDWCALVLSAWGFVAMYKSRDNSTCLVFLGLCTSLVTREQCWLWRAMGIRCRTITPEIALLGVFRYLMKALNQSGEERDTLHRAQKHGGAASYLLLLSNQRRRQMMKRSQQHSDSAFARSF